MINLLKNLKIATKLLRIYSDVTQFLYKTNLTTDIKDDINIIRQALERLAKKIPAIKELLEIIF